ncbi:hypothetical protein ASZ90_004948 [hydrocarbon metagenome]|uniref:TIR domain-containing protein n=1 Tax=hydrocarbon metagenome TaxID=938273 RepID=A0A0W8FWI5_9ZZZZ
MKNSIFISHANPADNDLARWLALRLMNLGYRVWADVLDLKGGNATWGVIENEIRNNTCKFLFLISKDSNQAEGCINELSVADSVRKKESLNDFIIPIKCDSLSYGEMNIYVNKLFAISFTKNWADGLKNLLEKFEIDGIPKSEKYDSSVVKDWWESVYLSGKTIINEKEEYLSNWYPIIKIPEYISFHKFKSYLPRSKKLPDFKYPAVKYSDYLATFAHCYDFMDELPKSMFYSQKNTMLVETADVIHGEVSAKWINSKDAKRILSQLLKIAWYKKFKNLDFLEYELSNKNIAYSLPDGFNKTNRIGRIKLVGTSKKKIWHYGISVFPKYYPVLGYGFKSHIFFSIDGNTFLENKNSQHRARRKLGRSWWNFHWREKLLGMIQYIGESENIELPVGSEETIVVSNQSISFYSSVSYEEPLSANTESADDDNTEDQYDEDDLDNESFGEEDETNE